MLFWKLSAGGGIEPCELIGQQCTEESFHLRYIHLTAFERQVSGIQGFEIRFAVVNDLIGYSWRAGQKRSCANREHDVGDNPGCSSIAISEWMYPVQPPDQVTSKVNRCAGLP